MTKTIKKTMIIKKLTYLGLALCFAVLAGCSDDITTPNTLSGDGTKTPLTVTAVLEAKGNVVKTRAADKEFASGDVLLAYLRHVTWNGGFTTADADKRTSITADQAPKLVTFNCTGSTAWNSSLADIYPFKADSIVAINGGNEGDSKKATGTEATKLYWDDFSVSTDDGTQDLRTDDHYLQSYYGYCYNGGDANITTALNNETGVLGWKIIADQSGTNGAENFKKSDLLWSAEQTPISYVHSTTVNGTRPGLIIPYTHAMSKVTIKVALGDGFDSNTSFEGTTITLNDMRLKCTANAPEAKLTYPVPSAETKGEVTMKQGTNDAANTFEAIVVPSILTVGNAFATITNMAGNKYTIPVTEKMVQEDQEGKNGWGSQLGSANEDVSGGTAQVKPMTRTYDNTIPAGTGFQMKSGVHYVLNVTVNKTEVNVTATILNWDEIEAEGVAEIHFDNDIKDKTGKIDEYLQENGFDVYKAAYAGEKDGKPIAPDFGTRATHLKYNKTSQTWKYDPVIYWQGGDAEYFRALANVRTDAPGTTDKNESLIMENGRDALWGTTAEADGYKESQAVNPRTGQVPLKFYHAMSQITFNLVDALAGNSDGSSHLELHGATIQLTNLATGGTIELFEGKITPSAITEKTFSEDPGAVPSRMGFFASKENKVKTTYKDEVTLRNYIITPQTIKNEAMVIITLADGTVYKAQLNECATEVTSGGKTEDEKITEWKRGNHYTYTIELGKETIKFRAVVENWNPVEGGGKATLEWD